MAIVLDASTALSWAFRDEQSNMAERALDAAGREGLRVPAFWPFEIASGLRQGERQGHIDVAVVLDFIRSLTTLRIALDQMSVRQVFDAPLNLARRHNLTVYDAAYLELAMREGVLLATLDRALERAAREAGVGLLA